MPQNQSDLHFASLGGFPPGCNLVDVPNPTLSVAGNTLGAGSNPWAFLSSVGRLLSSGPWSRPGGISCGIYDHLRFPPAEN
jgi:hypothetical protein